MKLTEGQPVRLRREAPRYPQSLLRHLGDRAPIAIDALGNLEILAGRTLGLFCSIKCPGRLIVQTYDAVRALRDAGVSVIGGFHSPMERECLELLLRGPQPVIVCPARSIARMRLPPEWKGPLAEGRLLLLSPFAEQDRRVTAELAGERNQFVAAVADELLIAHAEAGGKTEAFARVVAAWGKPLLTLADDTNTNLLALGATQLRPRDVAARLAPPARPETAPSLAGEL
jgi:predicted Rossmann fold nucleotide-binding protein DprA/Smf involved in DNA uptake